ncbi:MAG TPA: hypothetical protein VIL74_20615 [Pyrinomonadaceae bacterium]|jgi:hypothetical protein
MITVNPKKRIVRETTAPYKFVNDAGEIETAQIRVRYFSSTTKELKERFEEEKAKFKAAQANQEPYFAWHTESLVRRLESLPDLIDGSTGKPFPITLDFLESLESMNVTAIVDAIKEDENPKSESGDA